MTPAKALVVVCLLWSLQAHGSAWPSTIEQVARDLASEDVGVRRRAALNLQSLPASAERRLLPLALEDSDVEVRARAAAVAIRLGAPVAGKVIPWLTDREASLRRLAAEVLEVSPNENAAPQLRRVLGDPEPVVRAAAVRALVRSGDPDAALALLGRIDDADPRVRESVMEGLGELCDQRTTLAVIGKVRDPRASVRRGAIRVLGKLRDPRALSALLGALTDSEVEVQIAALNALGELRSLDSAQPIVALLRQTTRREVTEAALLGLAQIGSPEALGALVEATTSADEDQVMLARRAFAVAGDAALDPLRRCLTGQPALVLADGCVRALAYVPSTQAGEIVLDALRRGVVSPSTALLALARTNTEASLGTVLEYLASPDQVVRQNAILATAAALNPHNPDGRAIEPIASALVLARDDREERIGLIRLLGLTASPRAVPWLSPFLRRDGDTSTRLAAIEALGRIRGRGQGRLLLEALDDSSSEVRWSAALGLRDLDEAEIAGPLLSRIEVQAEQDRQVLGLALAGVLSTATDASVLRRVASLLGESRREERDAWIEAIGYIPGKGGSELLLELARASVDLDDHAKIAEALAAHPEARADLLELGRARAPEVRANAIWALTSLGTLADLEYLDRASKDEDPRVAANATAALARLAPRSPSVQSRLCTALRSDLAYVRANALVGLRLAKARCPNGVERDLLATDSNPLVRQTAARLLLEQPNSSDLAALARCRESDPIGSVALACTQAPEPSTDQRRKVTIFVRANGDTAPASKSPFVLVLGEGLVRLGRTDRRGAIFDASAVDGTLRLESPSLSDW